MWDCGRRAVGGLTGGTTGAQKPPVRVSKQHIYFPVLWRVGVLEGFSAQSSIHASVGLRGIRLTIGAKLGVASVSPGVSTTWMQLNRLKDPFHMGGDSSRVYI